MEGGYATLDDGALSLKNGQKLFLIRLPKDFNVEELNGKSIDLSGNATKTVEIDTTGKRKFFLKKDQTAVHSILRPIVRNDLDGSTVVGPAFSATYNLSEKIDIQLVPSADRYNSLPIRPAYVEVKQVDYLRVRTVPTGSTSHVDENGSIIPGKGVSSSLKKSKPTHVASVAPVAVESEATEEGEKSAKKQKKEKKHKEHKKDKSS